MTRPDRQDDRLEALVFRADTILDAARDLARKHFGDNADEVPLIQVQIASAMMQLDGHDRLEDRLNSLSQTISART